MASSSALTLVNKVLSTTGDYEALLSILNSPGGIAGKVIDFINIVLADIEQLSEWPELREEVSFNGDGATTNFIYSGASDVPPNGVGSVWVVGGDLLYELSSPQFDKVRALAASGSVPRYFRRGYDVATKNPSISIYPVPVAGVNNVKMTVYRRATKLDKVDDTAANSTEFDDGILLYGALMHMDAYDGQDRGYAALYEKVKNNSVAFNTRNTLRIPLAEFARWERRIPNAWKDPIFRDSYMKEHPEYNAP